MADLDLKEIHDTLVSLAFDAGKMIMAADPRAISSGTKLNCACHPLHLTIAAHDSCRFDLLLPLPTFDRTMWRCAPGLTVA